MPDAVAVARTPELANMAHDVPLLGVARGGRPARAISASTATSPA